MSYYQSFKKVFSNPLWNVYLGLAYRRCIKDLKKLGFQPNFKKSDFTCLLCGVAMERTADEFIRFVVARNPAARLWIVDLGEDQVRAVDKLVNERYQGADVSVRRINALDLDTLIREGSLDWIETDAFVQYFDSPALQELLGVWHRLLKPDGFVTFRDFATAGPVSTRADRFRIWLVRAWLKTPVFRHSQEELDALFDRSGFRAVKGTAILPTYKRFSLIKRAS